MISEIENQAAAEPTEGAEQIATTESRFDKLLANMTDEQVLRIHIFDGMASPEIGGKIMVENMKMVEDFIWEGAVPPDAEAQKKKPFKVVSKGE